MFPSETTARFPSRISKVDIGDPMPLSEETKKELAKQWSKVTPQMKLSEVNNNNNKKQVDIETPKSKPKSGTEIRKPAPRSIREASPRIRSNSVTDGDSYMSCSECGYQSICGTNCSCSLVISTQAEDDDDDSRTKIE